MRELLDSELEMVAGGQRLAINATSVGVMGFSSGGLSQADATSGEVLTAAKGAGGGNVSFGAGDIKTTTLTGYERASIAFSV